MCNEAFVRMASVVVGAAGQQQQARAMTSSALASQREQFAMLQDQEQQIDAQSTDAMSERAKQALRDAGHVNAVFADSGLSGNTQDRIMAEVQGNAAADQTTLERNRAARITQAQAEGSGIAARTQTAINSVRRPSLIGSGLQIATYGADWYDKTHPKPPPDSGYGPG